MNRERIVSSWRIGTWVVSLIAASPRRTESKHHQRLAKRHNAKTDASVMHRERAFLRPKAARPNSSIDGRGNSAMKSQASFRIHYIAFVSEESVKPSDKPLAEFPVGA